ncbi:uncharacterized protein LOC120006525 [Tripterygium wilfordii]|uniref:uncharacterized protein LOC120006525 n=1 Tax=Tripterygium wilfordii TaxID=458696 RepID=UPI0018F84E7F|nr:uncharacterized protein LOC120006525 [Tripterygium wilfordii]
MPRQKILATMRKKRTSQFTTPQPPPATEGSTSGAATDYFDIATLVPEVYLSADLLNKVGVRSEPFGRLRHFCSFIATPDVSSAADVPVYPSLVRAFYRTVEATGPGLYQAILPSGMITFSAADVSASIGHPTSQPPDSGFQPPIPSAQLEDHEWMVQHFTGRRGKFVRKSALPQVMYLVDRLVHGNLWPTGHQSERREEALEILYCIWTGTWFDLGHYYIQSFLAIRRSVEDTKVKVKRLFLPRIITRLLTYLQVLPLTLQSVSLPMVAYDLSNWRISISRIRSAPAGRARYAPGVQQFAEEDEDDEEEDIAPSDADAADHDTRIKEMSDQLTRLEHTFQSHAEYVQQQFQTQGQQITDVLSMLQEMRRDKNLTYVRRKTSGGPTQ